MPDHAATDSTILEKVSVSSAQAATGRRRPHTQTEWANIRPSLKHLYIDSDMTLRDAMQRIAEEHDFRAT